MKTLAISVLLLALPTSVLAQSWTTRSTDQTMTRDDLAGMIQGQVLSFYDGGTSDFRRNGQYFYTYGGGGTWEGSYVVGTDSKICVTYVTGSTRCDLYVMAGGRLTVITEDGLRFPIREIAAPRP